ncbi:MAG: Mpo1-like protein [Rubrivivax sp.]
MASAFSPAAALLTQYALHHRDRRNIATHVVGVPMIVFAIGVLLSRPSFQMGSLLLSPAWVLFAAAALWYLTRGALLLGMAVSAAMALLLLLAHRLPGGGVGPWLGWGLGFFVVGWVIQFVGHYYEGRKPAFVDDSVGLLVGPMFVTLELLSPLGLFKPLMAEIERHAGPPVLRNLAHPA